MGPAPGLGRARVGDGGGSQCVPQCVRRAARDGNLGHCEAPSPDGAPTLSSGNRGIRGADYPGASVSPTTGPFLLYVVVFGRGLPMTMAAGCLPHRAAVEQARD
jgi:hypothetical protein